MPKKSKPVMTTVRLTPELVEAIEAAQAKSGRASFSDEVRALLTAAISADTPTGRLLEMIDVVARDIEGEFTKGWHEDPYLFHAFKSAVVAILDTRKVEGKNDDNPPAPKSIHDDWAGSPTQAPTEYGQELARSAIRAFIARREAKK